VILPPINQTTQQAARTKFGGGRRQKRGSLDWREWIKRQQEQMALQLSHERNAWHDQRHKFFEILWQDVPSEEEMRHSQFKKEDKKTSGVLPFVSGWLCVSGRYEFV